MPLVDACCKKHRKKEKRKGFDEATTATGTFSKPSSGAKGTSPGVSFNSLAQKRVLFDPCGIKNFKSGELGFDELKN